MYLYVMAHRLQILLSREQYAFLDAEADRSSVSMAELIRRAIDTTYGIDGDGRVLLITHTLGRRVGRRLRD
ncbi:MAG TPA: ribbon-helix-helix protein, CopG family [Gaiellaceae bacterium]|nr:ribbon-helix-helix protein, CopG family [Gaiellaceae bacterium]